MAVAQRRMTLEEFLELPQEGETELEYLDGEVVEKVSPQGKHSLLTLRLPMRINSFAEPRKLAMAFPELRATFAGWSPVADIAVYAWDRIPLDPTGEVADRFVEPPDIAIEIVSPGQRVALLTRKCLWYVENGVKLVLLVDPDDRTVFRFKPGGMVTVLRGPDRIDFGETLPGFELTVAELFGLLSPGAGAIP